MTEVIDQDTGEVTTMTELEGAGVVANLDRASIDMQIATAHRFPRSITRFKRETESLACLDEETAATMFYSLPRGGKNIVGPSVRFAEVVASSWGNIRSGARIIDIDDKFITAQGQCFDLEKNICVQVEVKRRITKKDGKRYDDDMIGVTGNAACSIALRNAVFKVVPFGLAKSIYEKCMDIVKGDAKTLGSRREAAMAWFLKVGATQEQVLGCIGKASMDDVTVDDLVTLQGLRNAIKDGESSIEEALGPVPDKSKKVRTSTLNEKAGAKSKDEPPAEDDGLNKLLDGIADSQDRASFYKKAINSTVNKELLTRLGNVIEGDESIDAAERDILAATVAKRIKAL